jgi:hypothetical protein
MLKEIKIRHEEDMKLDWRFAPLSGLQAHQDRGELLKMLDKTIKYMASYCGACPIESDNCTSDNGVSCQERIINEFLSKLDSPVNNREKGE